MPLSVGSHSNVYHFVVAFTFRDCPHFMIQYISILRVWTELMSFLTEFEGNMRGSSMVNSTSKSETFFYFGYPLTPFFRRVGLRFHIYWANLWPLLHVLSPHTSSTWTSALNVCTLPPLCLIANTLTSTTYSPRRHH